MFRSPHVRGKQLADLCHRLAISDDSGIDVRRTWQREAGNARGAVRDAFELVRRGVASGDTLADSLAATGGLFPRLFLEMVDVGEKTGCLGAVLHRLSGHYQRSHELARDFRRRLAWPALELTAALTIVGLMLALFAALDVRDLSGDAVDLLGIGATGGAAVTRYVQILLCVGLAASLLVVSWRQGAAWTRPLPRLAMRLPGVGPCLEKIALARLTWAMHLTLNVEMNLRKLAPLVLRATDNDFYARRSARIVERIEAGGTLHEAFASAGVFPPHFLDALQVAEESGQITESMGRLSKQYDEEAGAAMQTLVTFLSFAVWGAVALVVVTMIFRLFSFYVGVLNDAASF